MESPAWIQHSAFQVQSPGVLHQAKAGLQTQGLQVLGPVDHDGYVLSIYFNDPSGHRLEQTTQVCSEAQLARYEAEAPDVLAQWARSHQPAQ